MFGMYNPARWSSSQQTEIRRQLDETYRDMNNLRIVLLGNNISENSSVGNLILGRAAFESEAASSDVEHYCERARGKLKNGHITVINNPYLLDPKLSSHHITLGVRECVSLSDPGPNVIILILKHNDFSVENSNRVKHVLNLFSEQAIKHTLVLNTAKDAPLSSVRENDFIHQLTEKYGKERFFQIEKTKHDFSSEIFRRVERIITENKEYLKCEIEINMDAEGSSVDKENTGTELCSPYRIGDKYTQQKNKEEKGYFYDLFPSGRGRSRSPDGNRPNMRIVLLGKNVSENSRVGNFILGREAFESKAASSDVEHYCERVRGKLKNGHITVINNPYLLDPKLSSHHITQGVRECVSLSDPGPHVIVLVLKHDECSRVVKVLNSFSNSVYKHTMVLTAQESDTVDPKDIIKEISIKCFNRHFKLNKKSNTADLLKAFEEIVRNNNGCYLTYNTDEDSYLATEGECEKLNLALIGRDKILKTFISKLILNHREKRSEHVVQQGEVCGRLISLMELPALTQISKEEMMREIVSLCKSRVHVFLLVIPDGQFTDEDKAEMDEIQRIFGPGMNKHTMVLIWQNSEHRTEEQNGETKSVIDSFGGQHHFFGPNIQVSMLMKKLEEMVKENSDDCFSTETILDTWMEMRRKTFSLEKYYQSQEFKETSDDVRIVLLGKTGVGKSATGNNILGREAFTADSSQESVTKECQRESAEINGRRITVIDTPGLFDTDPKLTNEETQREITNCISMILPGPHVFIIVLSLAQRFTQEEAKSVEIIQETFGKNSLMYTMVLFTRGDDLKNKTIDQCLGKGGAGIRILIKQCENRYHVFNNNETTDRTQVSALLDKINTMVKTNGDSYYSCKMFREMERDQQEKLKKMLMERVEEVNREKEELMRKQKEEKEKMKMMMDEERQNQNKEMRRREEESREREEQYKREIKEKDEQVRIMQEKMKREREEWERQKQKERQSRDEERKELNRRIQEERQRCDEEREELKRRIQEERQRRDEEDKRRRKIDQETWDEYYQKFKREREIMYVIMEQERITREKEKKRREREFRKTEEQYKRDIKDIEEKEREMREEMRREREKWEKKKQKERQRNEKKKEQCNSNEIYRRALDLDETPEQDLSIEQRIEILKQKESKIKTEIETLNDSHKKEMESMRTRLEEKKQKTDEERLQLEKKFKDKLETLRKYFEEKEETEKKKQETENQKRLEEEKQQKAKYDQKLEQMKREIENQESQYEQQIEKKEDEDKKNEEKYKQDLESIKNDHECIINDRKMKQEEENKKRDLEKQIRIKQEEKEREEWERKINEAANDKIKEIKQQQKEWEDKNKRHMREQEEDDEKMKERHQEELKEKQEELKYIRETFEREREEDKQNTEEDEQRWRAKERTDIEQKKKEYEKIKRSYEKLEQEKKDEWKKRKREDDERREEKRKRWMEMIKNLKQEQEEEIKRRETEEKDRLEREEKECDDIKKECDQKKQHLKKLQDEAEKLAEELNKFKDQQTLWLVLKKTISNFFNFKTNKEKKA